MMSYAVAFDGGLCFQGNARGIPGDINDEVGDWITQALVAGNKVYVLTWREPGLAIAHLEAFGFPLEKFFGTKRFFVQKEIPVGMMAQYIFPNGFTYEEGKLPPIHEG